MSTSKSTHLFVEESTLHTRPLLLWSAPRIVESGCAFVKPAFVFIGFLAWLKLLVPFGRNRMCVLMGRLDKLTSEI